MRRGGKSHEKLKKGPILSRAEDIIYDTGLRMSHHYNIFDIETRRYTSRDRCNIRKYNNTHTDKRLMQKLVKFCNELKVHMVATKFRK